MGYAGTTFRHQSANKDNDTEADEKWFCLSLLGADVVAMVSCKRAWLGRERYARVAVGVG